MSIGTIGAFFLPMITNSSQKKENEALQKLIEEQQAQQQAASEPLDGYSAEAFNKDSVTELKVETLKEPSGDKAATPQSTVTANYFGWTSDGKIFDSSKKNGTATPVPFSLGSVIKGWTEGLTGAKSGGVYKLTIPADKAYGNTDDGSGRPVGPLVFIVEVTNVE
jgi:peptidylprolyl isomerase